MRWALTLFCMTLIPCLSGAENQLVGAWRSGSGKDAAFIHIEGKRAIFLAENQRIICGLTIHNEHLELVNWGVSQKQPYSMKDGKLILKTEKGDMEYEKLEIVPAALKLEKLVLGQEKLGAEVVATIRNELAQRKKKDQEVRAGKEPDPRMNEVDSENTAYLVKLVKRYGWIDAKRFGAEAANDAFLLTQHSMDLPLMMSALAEVEKDVKAKRVDGQNFALLYDRVHLMLGGKQRYGSQFFVDREGTLVFYPLEDYVKTEAYRKEIGLFSFERYVQIIQQMNGERDVKFLGEE